MYNKFYGLTASPFEISPDPRFLFRTERHNEALANLFHGVSRHKGFVVLTGEVGTGKTLLLRCLVNLLTRNQVAFASVFNPGLTTLEFLQYILTDFGLASGGNKTAMLNTLNAFLIERYRKGLTTVLLVDEAQHLSAELLEEIRLLTNLETAQQKLLQIVLAGQPELDLLLDSPQLRQLKQRIALRCRLEPLNRAEVRAYITGRLHQAGAGARARALFSEAAIEAIQRYSGGIPRLVNTICENALITGYARELQVIGPEVIEEVAADFRLGVVTSPAAPSARPGGSGELRLETEPSRKAMMRTLVRMFEMLAKNEETTVPASRPSSEGVRTA